MINIQKNIVRTMALLVIFCLLSICFCSCSKNEQIAYSNAKVRIAASIFPQYDFTRAIAGDLFGTRVVAKMLVQPGAESHTFQPTISDMSVIEKANLIILAGGEIDSWAKEEIIDVIPETDRKVIYLLEYVDGIEEEEDEDEEGTPEIDEHVWTSIRNSIELISVICKNMCDIDPEMADVYTANALSYIEQLSELDEKFTILTKKAENKTWVFADRFPLAYFERDYGLNHISALKGCSSVSEPPLSKVAEIYNSIKKENVSAVFTVEFSDGILADTIAEGCNVKHLEFQSCHNVSKQDFESGVTYLELMTRNYHVLKEAFDG